MAADWPSKFNFLDVLPDRVSVGVGQFENPIANRSASRCIHTEPCGQFFRAINHSSQMCHFWHVFATPIWAGKRGYSATELCKGKQENTLSFAGIFSKGKAQSIQLRHVGYTILEFWPTGMAKDL